MSLLLQLLQLAYRLLMPCFLLSQRCLRFALRLLEFSRALLILGLLVLEEELQLVLESFERLFAPTFLDCQTRVLLAHGSVHGFELSALLIDGLRQLGGRLLRGCQLRGALFQQGLQRCLRLSTLCQLLLHAV